MTRPALFLAAATLLLGACGNGESKPEPEAPSSVTGVIVEVAQEGLTEVESFSLRAEDETYQIYIADDVDYGFPLSHLNEHRVSGDPVRVELEERDEKLYALSIVDV